MAKRLISPRCDIANPSLPKPLLQVVKEHAPDIHGLITGSKDELSRELDGLEKKLKGQIASQPGFTPELGAQLAALPATSLAMLFLNVYRPNENDTIRMNDPEVIEFIARLGAGARGIPLARSIEYMPISVGGEAIERGSSRSFELFVKEGYGKAPAKRGAETQTQYSEFPDLFLDAMSTIENMTMENAGLLAQLVADASEFLACFIVAQPNIAAMRFELAQEAIEDKRRVANIQPMGVYADIGCGEDGISCIDTLDKRQLLLVDNSPLVIGMLGSYLSRIGRRDVYVANRDMVSASYTPGSLGLVNIEFALHYGSEEEIARAIGNLVPALAPYGVIHIKEPEKNCCNRETPEKLDAIRRKLVSDGLHVIERIEKTSFSWIWAHPEDNETNSVEFIAAKRREDLERLLSEDSQGGNWRRTNL